MERTPLAAAYQRWRRSDTSEGRDWPATRFSSGLETSEEGWNIVIGGDEFLLERIIVIIVILEALTREFFLFSSLENDR